jgi:hypothetical protein
MAMYWIGLPVNANYFRIDQMKRFNGTPFAAYRDIVDLTRPK